MFALVDCNSFYASCEQIFRPDLRHRPVVVLSNNDGCIVARNAAAKALNIPDLQAYFMLKPLLEQHRVAVFSSNYALYADISQRVVDTLSRFSSELEVYSIDESFLSLKQIGIPLPDYGQQIKHTVWRDVRMPVCVGIGPSKTLAKLANHIAKKSQRLHGVCMLDQPAQWHAVFKKLPVSKVWGVGHRLAKRLAMFDIHTVYDLQAANAKHIRKHFSVNLARTIAELNGEACLSLENQPSPKQQIYSTRSFGQRVYTLEGLLQAVSLYATRAAGKLRQQHSLVKTITAFVQTSRFDTEPYRNSATVVLPYASNDTRHIIAASQQAVRSIFRPGHAYAKAGVGLIELIDEQPSQLNFFQQYQTERSRQLMQTLDQLNRQQAQVFFASSGIDPDWQMQRQFKSPAYTTKLDELPLIHTR
ncbi:MAG: Y-family DNA polymerase [Pseudomonadales bacterium]|nr:Y-family DNA polymerase [Pseudomonadales bacterium]